MTAPLNLYSNSQMINMACKYSTAVYRSTPSAIRDEKLLHICAYCSECSYDNTPWPWTEPTVPSRPRPFSLAEILAIIGDPYFSWDWTNNKPKQGLIEDFFPGGLDKDLQLICPVANEPNLPANQALLRKVFAEILQTLSARTYYFDLCKMSQLYISYKKFVAVSLGQEEPKGYSFLDSYSTSDGSLITNVVPFTIILSEWKNTTPPSTTTPIFAEWLFGNYDRPCCEYTLDDALYCFNGIQNIMGNNTSGSWWIPGGYGDSSPVAGNFGNDSTNQQIGPGIFTSIPLSIRAGQTKRILINGTTTPVYRISWNNLWYPFISSSNLVAFSEYVGAKAMLNSGPTVATPSLDQFSCYTQIGACCIDNGAACQNNVTECECDRLSGVWSANETCDNICPTSSSSSTSSVSTNVGCCCVSGEINNTINSASACITANGVWTSHYCSGSEVLDPVIYNENNTCYQKYYRAINDNGVCRTCISGIDSNCPEYISVTCE